MQHNKIESNNDEHSKNDITCDSALYKISKNLNVEFITPRSISNNSERSDSSNNITEAINVNEAVDLNELEENVPNNRHAVLNDDVYLSVRSNNSSEETIQIRIKSIFELWNFFISYLNTELLRVFQSSSRDVMGE
ncbi:13642_t:CDS:2, partial [Racocetra fulgida]